MKVKWSWMIWKNNKLYDVRRMNLIMKIIFDEILKYGINVREWLNVDNGGKMMGEDEGKKSMKENNEKIWKRKWFLKKNEKLNNFKNSELIVWINVIILMKIWEKKYLKIMLMLIYLMNCIYDWKNINLEMKKIGNEDWKGINMRIYQCDI